MLSFKQFLLYESFDRPYDISIKREGEDRVTYAATLPDNKTLSVWFEKIEDDKWATGFDMDSKSDSKDAIRILATVMEAVRAFRERKKTPKFIRIDIPKRDVFTKEDASKKLRLFRTLIDKHSRNLGYKVQSVSDTPAYIVYELKKARKG